MGQNYLLDTNAYFNLLKLLRKYNENAKEYPECIKQLLSGNLCISTVTKVEIISVLGKYARGNNGGYNKLLVQSTSILHREKSGRKSLLKHGCS